MGRLGRERAESLFSMERNSVRMIEVYEELT